MKKIDFIAIIDSSSISCEGLKSILDRRRFQIKDVWNRIDEAIKAGPAGYIPAAILINSAIGDLPSDRSLAQLRETYPGTRVILISEKCDLVRIQKSLKAGIDGFLLETIQPEAVSKAIEMILMGERVFPATHLAHLVQAEDLEGEIAESIQTDMPVLDELSAGQKRVLALIAKAYPNKIIARELNISESTVKVHVKAILRKTGARNRTDVALLARGLRVEDPQEHNAFEAASACPRKTKLPTETVNPIGSPAKIPVVVELTRRASIR
ncbi:response regulator transcription factor [Pseudoruegeria sp. SK021]|uniref:LuxR C-terminal-related transcriptional regulator n=1 Tax=Pseudoruegeria sp. SK021 TaxID=1933035 RepID=UPI00143E07AE|nr:response regulator transcription factor [Pseudoruegeria sp. SK021]